MNKSIQWIIGIVAVSALFLSLAGLVGGNNQSALELGASGTRFPNGISADSTPPVAGEVRGTDLTITDDAVVSGGSLNVTTANSATSTLIVGCIQTYATSTATAVRLSATTTASVGSIPLWVFGSCPI